MSQSVRSLLVVLGMALFTTVGDYCLKRASQKSLLANPWLLGGWLIYGTTAMGWAWAMRHLKLATIGAVYSISMVLLMALLGLLAFRETLNRTEIAGLLCALISIVLLARFTE
ncbi:MAG: transporter [Acidobacteria bacterium]|nr:transporter [Acidobacteriota bacterium]MBI3421584.1 transporter [Acidobacteriota bacterium]